MDSGWLTVVTMAGVVGLVTLLRLGFLYLGINGLILRFTLYSKNPLIHARKIQNAPVPRAAIDRELRLTISTILIYAAVIVLVVLLHTHFGAFPNYVREFGAFSWTYTIVAVVIVIAVHDIYFYFTHRLLHWKPLFRTVHRVHHLSFNPTAYSCLAFHPAEALVQIGIFPVILLLIPCDLLILTAFSFFTFLTNTMGHAGFEFYSMRYLDWGLHRFFNSSTNHNMHHKSFNANYGLYTPFLDRLFGTEHPEYVDALRKTLRP
jgi:sterol desaturase/sphingolipid hydroxylase (fatty acid hydroxylase superfamily)